MTPCIEWDRARNKQGYGIRRFRGKPFLSHRAAWIEANGEIPEGMCVLHKCDNPPCINTEHLFIGTQLQNIEDCRLKGRKSHKSVNAGISQWKRKITEQTAIRIKMVYGVLTVRSVADALGIGAQGVHDIMTGKNWKHVTANTRYSF